MMDRKEAVRQYKKTVHPMGIVQGTINSIRFQLKMGSFLPSPGPAKDWREMGEQSFVVEVSNKLKPVDDTAYDQRDGLKALEELWLETLKPFGKRGYQ